MSEADRLNAILEHKAPALARCLSPLGRAVAFPRGIPFQATAARATRLNGTIGQVTDGAGAPLPLPVLADAVPGLDAKMTFLYAPQPGHQGVRDKWLRRQLALAGRQKAACTLPFVTHGLTHGINLIVDLFVDEHTTVVLPDPAWENYDLLFTMRAPARIARWAFFEDGTLNLEGLARALDGVTGKAVILLNFPSNPTGYSPTAAEADAIVALVASHPGPAVVIVDDAYQGVVHEPDAVRESLFWRLSDAVDPERAVVLKVDGATKELLFFPSRIGFLTASVGDLEAEEAWLSKLNCVVRGTVGGPPGPSQAMMMPALDDHARTEREFQAILAQLTARYHALKGALADVASDRIRPYPFNAAYFALVGLADGIDPDKVRERLIAERSVGLIAIPEVNALRVAYCSTRPEDVVAIVHHLAEVVATE